MNIQKFISQIEKIVKNPSTYVAAVIGALIGCGIGGVIGAIAGGFIGYDYNLLNGCSVTWAGREPSIAMGSIIGLIAGILIGGGLTVLITIYKIYKKNKSLTILSSDNISETILGSLGVSIEIAIGMGLGAIIGSLKLPGIGSALGAIVGLLLMLFTGTLAKKRSLSKNN